MFEEINDLEQFNKTVEISPAVLAYFSTQACNVCKVLKPKVAEMTVQEFPELKLVYVQLDHAPDLAAQNRVFAVPTLVIYFEGKEFFRKSRNFGIDELRKELQRPYELMFS